ncbi:MAG TPA: cytochrome c oxidase subunit II [Microthrixaceae bacterium]|nr:cytochrome c oxidase subunit II [Microthrixaceae bacterium]
MSIFVVTGTFVIAGGCSGSSPSIVDDHGVEAQKVAGVWWFMFILAIAVYVVVASLIIIGVLRGPRGAEESTPSDSANDLTPVTARDPGDARWIWVGGIIVPVIILTTLAVVTIRTVQTVRRPSNHEVTIIVNGERWWWDVRYPEGSVRTANEIHIPVGRTVNIELHSNNVVHSFWVPQIAGKLDVMPGQTNRLRLKATEVGRYRGQCAEYCGIGHARMAFMIVAETDADFQRWLIRRERTASGPTSEITAEGQRVFMSETCSGCHTIRGTSATAQIGPDLSDFGSRDWIGSVTVLNTPENLTEWIRDSHLIKPGSLMPPITLDDSEVAALVAYLGALK